jgi:hypothetical protein
MSISIGHDGECFAVSPEGEVISCEGKIGGTKADPSPCEGGALQEDCVMAELNIKPAFSKADFIKYTTQVQKELEHRLAEYNLKPYYKPVAELDAMELNTKQAQISGCVADYDAWAGKKNPAIQLAASNKRYAGGHVHFGVPFAGNPIVISRFIRYLDYTMGAGLIIKFGTSERFHAYGRWGAYRPTPYGVEYRTPDNLWLTSEETMAWVYDIGLSVAQRFAMNPNADAAYPKEVLDSCIETGDMTRLRGLVNKHIPHPLLNI